MQDKSQKNDKVILFPKLKDQLIKKGMEHLKAKNFWQALENFIQLSELYDDVDHLEEVQYGIVVCLLELERLQEAKEKCKRLLHEDIGEYYNILQLYLTILIQLNEYSEVTTILEAVTQERKLPPEHAEHFFQILDFSRKMMNQPQANEERENREVENVNELVNGLLVSENPDKQMAYIKKLQPLNIKGVVPSLKPLLMKNECHPAIKTMILQLLIEQDIREIVTVSKFGDTKKINIRELDNVFEQPFAVSVLTILEEELGNENPTLFDVTRQLWEHYLFILFPFLPSRLSEQLWAAALHIVGYEMHGIDISIEEIKGRYGVNQDEVMSAVKAIKAVEMTTLSGHHN